MPTAHRRALERICDCLAGSGVPWAVTGSVALALHGVPVACGDLDVVTSAADASAFEALFAGHVVEPVAFTTRGRLRGHLGRLQLAGVDVEVLGDVQNLLPDGTWTAPPQLDAHVIRLQLGERSCPVLDLAYLHDAYRAMGRAEKVALIARALPA